VIEDDFSHARPPLDDVGAQFVADVSPFEIVKKRLLNGTHCAIGYLGSLAGHRTSADVMTDPILASFVEGFLDEIVPLLPSPPGLDLEDYADTVEARLENPEIADDLSRLCRRGSVKVPSYLLPSLADALDRRRPHPLLTLATAGYIRYLADEEMTVEDPRADELVELARRSEDDPRPLLEQRDVFGDLADSEAAVTELQSALAALRSGPHAAIGMYVDQQRAA
jgi:mannitol-1-phosphate/altronate dehydrogenase